MAVLLLTLCLVGTSIAFAPSARAADSTAPTNTLDFVPEIPIPGVFEGPQPSDTSLLSHYIRAVYIYLIWVVGTFATLMVVYGGIRWVAAAGNPGQIKEAREIIDGAIIGVLIALTSVVLLNIINPNLTKLNYTGLNYVAKKSTLNFSAKGVCSTDLNVLCGAMKPVGPPSADTTSSAGYCIGTKKDPKMHGDDWVCQLVRTDDKKEFISGTLLPTIPIYTADPAVPTDQKIAGKVILPVKSTGDRCGDVVRPFFSTDPRVALDHQGEVGYCYLDDIYAVYDPAKDIITNMCWPGDPCPKK